MSWPAIILFSIITLSTNPESPAAQSTADQTPKPKGQTPNKQPNDTNTNDKNSNDKNSKDKQPKDKQAQDKAENATAEKPTTKLKSLDPVEMTPIDNIKPIDGRFGIKHWIIKEGKGKRPTPDARVLIHYTGWLTDGSVYTTTKRQGWASNVDLKRSFITGLTKVVLEMKPGGHRRVLLPPEMAFGERGYTGKVPPNEPLTFEIELLDVDFPPRPSKVEGLKRHQTKSGLIFWDIKEGKGEPVGPDAMVTVKFSRWLEDGSIIDTTEFEKDQATFLLTQVIKGWAEGISTMRIGGVRQMQIPPDLAFGQKGQPPSVAPNATIISKIELLSARTLKKKPKPKKQPKTKTTE